MNKNNIRSEYIKNLIADKDALAKKLNETTKDTLKSVLEESVNKNLREILSEAEDEDSYEEEEVDSEETTDTENLNDTEEETTDTDVDTEVETDTEDVSEPLDDADAESDVEDDVEGEDDWSDLEQYKGEDGEFDLTGMDKDTVIKVLKKMKPTDAVRVIKDAANVEKSGENELTATDETGENEYIIQFGDSEMDDMDFESDEETFDDTEDFDDTDDMNENVGYTDNYQNKTAMTTPSNNEPANPKNTYSMDDGVPTGTEKPFPGKGKKDPFTEVTEGCCEFEVETDDDDEVDEATTVANGAQANSVVKTHGTNNTTRPVARNGSVAGRKVKGTADARYSNVQMENIMRKANAIFTENKQLKDIANKIKEKLTEATVINHSLGKIIKLVTENTTTRDEKIDIVKRFNDVKTINESAKLYDTISNELKSTNRVNANINNNNVQLAESKNNIVETPIYQSDDLTETLSLMSRMEKL